MDTQYNNQNTNQSSRQGEWIHTDSSQPPMTCKRVSRYMKSEARGALLGHLGTAVGANVLYFVLILLLSWIVSAFTANTAIGIFVADILSLLVGILSGILEYGLATIYMNLQYQQFTRVSDLFAGFRENSNKIILIGLYLAVIETLCALPCTIALYFANETASWIVAGILAVCGIIATYYIEMTYALSLYVLLDYPDMNWKDVLRKSRYLMKGHKKHLLYISVSFLPLYLLSVLSFGIAAIVVFAYEQAAKAAFYKGRMENRMM